MTRFTAAVSFCFLFASVSAGQEVPPRPQVPAAEQPANPTQEIAGEQPEGPALGIGPAQLPASNALIVHPALDSCERLKAFHLLLR